MNPTNTRPQNTLRHHGEAVAHLDHFSYWYGGRQQRTQVTSFYDTSPSETGNPLPERQPDLDDICLAFEPGSVTLLCGLSGSGKSSIIQALNGLIPHFHAGEASGHVEVNRHDIAQTDLTECGMQSATVFQNPRTQFFTTCVWQRTCVPLGESGTRPRLDSRQSRGRCKKRRYRTAFG